MIFIASAKFFAVQSDRICFIVLLDESSLTRCSGMISVPRVLVVGGGVTAGATCCLLTDKLSETCHVSVWDKARGEGGRMSTSRGPECKSYADLGAQYITVSDKQRQKHARFYDLLNSADPLTPLPSSVVGLRPPPPGTCNLVPPAGFRSVVSRLFQHSRISPQFGQRVLQLNHVGDKVEVFTSDDRCEQFDAVILTMPAPQILSLEGALVKSLECSDVKQCLSDVKFSSRFALAVFFDRANAISTSWSVQFLPEDLIFCYVAVDNLRRGRVSENTSVVFHTNTQFGSEHVEKSPDQLKETLLKHVAARFPDWPLEGATIKCHKWRFSQVIRPYSGAPGHVVLHQRPLVVAAGDSFTETSGFNSCLDSAVSVADCVGEYLQSRAAGSHN